MNVHFNTCIMAVIIHLFFKLNLNKTRICMQQQYWFLLHCCSCTALHGNLLVSSKELTTVLGVCLQWQRILLGSRHGMTTVKNGRPFFREEKITSSLLKRTQCRNGNLWPGGPVYCMYVQSPEKEFIFTLIEICKGHFGGDSESLPLGRRQSQLVEIKFLINRFEVRRSYGSFNHCRAFEKLLVSK